MKSRTHGLSEKELELVKLLMARAAKQQETSRQN